jgi:hypothetical protein
VLSMTVDGLNPNSTTKGANIYRKQTTRWPISVGPQATRIPNTKRVGTRKLARAAQPGAPGNPTGQSGRPCFLAPDPLGRSTQARLPGRRPSAHFHGLPIAVHYLSR